MNREEIIALAIECGDDWYSTLPADQEFLIRFAALVAAAEREACNSLWEAQPEPEPVAWMIYTLDGASVCVTDSPSDFTSEYRALPIYATPPQRKPLTDEEIDKVTDAQWAQNNHKPIYAAHRAYARAIEKAHGIGGEE